MNEENKKKLQIKYDPSIEGGVYSNAVSVSSNKNEMIIDFGYILPNVKPSTIKIVSRVNLTQNTAESFLKVLSNAVLDMKNKLGENDEGIFYGNADLNGTVTGKLTGASGEHRREDHHGELQDRSSFLSIYYEEESPPLTGNGAVSLLTIDYWLGMPSGVDMGSKFPEGP